MVDLLDASSLTDRGRRSVREDASSESTVRSHSTTLSVPSTSTNLLTSKQALIVPTQRRWLHGLGPRKYHTKQAIFPHGHEAGVFVLLYDVRY